MIILFDIDRTLVDTDKFKKKAHRTILPSLLGISPEDLQVLHDSYLGSIEASIYFSPRKFTSFLQDELNFGEEIRKEVLDTWVSSKNIWRSCVYPEVSEALESLKVEHFLGIFSEGNFEYQNAKLSCAGLLHYFEPRLIFIFPDKIETVENVEGKLVGWGIPVYIVDDNVKHVQNFSGSSIVPIHLSREKDSDWSGFKISSLAEIENIISLEPRE